MSKHNYFIPVKTGTGNFTFISSKKIKSLQAIIPEDKDVISFLKEMFLVMESDTRLFQTIKIVVTQSLFEEIKKEINSYIRNSVIDSGIDLLLEKDQVPTIQIIVKN